MSIYKIAENIFYKLYYKNIKWRPSITPVDVAEFIKWSKRRRAFFFIEAVSEWSFPVAMNLCSVLERSGILVKFYMDQRSNGHYEGYSIYVYNEAAEELWT